MAESINPGALRDLHSLQGVLQALADTEVEYVICGGVACILHGISRTTADLDIAVRMDEPNLLRLIHAARRLGFQPRIPEPLEHLLDASRRRLWIEEKNATVFTLVSLYQPLQVDVFLQYPIPFDDLKARANVLASANVTIPVSSKEDLIIAKRLAGREQDQRDIRDLEELIHDEQQRQGRVPGE